MTTLPFEEGRQRAALAFTLGQMVQSLNVDFDLQEADPLTGVAVLYANRRRWKLTLAEEPPDLSGEQAMLEHFNRTHP